MEEEILNISRLISYDESVAHYEVHAYASSTTNNSDEIQSKSFLHIQGKLVKEDGTPITNTRFIINAICHIFEEARYELNTVEIDKNKNVSLTSFIKNYISVYEVQSKFLENAGWFPSSNANTSLTDDTGNFDISITLNTIFGFAEDYQKMVVNARHELILTRSRNYVNEVLQTADEQFKIIIDKIECLLPSVKLSDARKFKLLKYIKKDPLIPICFRKWELYEYPMLPITSNHVWTFKTSTQLKKPRLF